MATLLAYAGFATGAGFTLYGLAFQHGWRAAHRTADREVTP